MLLFFKDYLDAKVCDFAIHKKAIDQALADHFLEII
jgi:hypothetical protein